MNNLCIPSPLLFLGKSLLALPLTYHTFNGIRHLVRDLYIIILNPVLIVSYIYTFMNLQGWDMGKYLTIKGVYSTGYVVSALAVVSAFVLAAM